MEQEQKTLTQNKLKRLKSPGLVASYDLRPANRKDPILLLPGLHTGPVCGEGTGKITGTVLTHTVANDLVSAACTCVYQQNTTDLL